jgi:V-type H+-transporting ATPase subunit C
MFGAYILAEVYLTRFKWDEAKFPSRRPLKETVDKIMEIVARVEDDLKVCGAVHA